ncbi:MAG: GxxExxY protein, partial [Bacteroidales bacterium]|nr:GxxExxY protein [Bacteroidales bacterium]
MNLWHKITATDSQIEMMEYSNLKYPYQEKSYKIIGICMEVHRILGKGFLEIVYKDALEYEFKLQNIPYE